MKKTILFLLVLSFMFCASYIYADVYEELEIKQGTHEKVISEKYGEPLMAEKLKSGFLPIPKKKALYKLDESTYMILYFFSGRAHQITILEDAGLEEAANIFRKD